MAEALFRRPSLSGMRAGTSRSSNTRIETTPGFGTSETTTGPTPSSSGIHTERRPLLDFGGFAAETGLAGADRRTVGLSRLGLRTDLGSAPWKCRRECDNRRQRSGNDHGRRGARNLVVRKRAPGVREQHRGAQPIEINDFVPGIPLAILLGNRREEAPWKATHRPP